MGIRRRIRKPHSWRAPKLRRSAASREAAKDDGEAAGGLMIGGAKDPAEIRADARVAKALVGAPALNRANQTWTDWVPGDWGYIASQTPKGWEAREAGMEGKNIVYLADGKSWGHGGEVSAMALDQWVKVGAQWSLGAELNPLRIYPQEGLKNG